MQGINNPIGIKSLKPNQNPNFLNTYTSHVPPKSGIVATGGVEEIINGYTYRKFASDGTFAVTAGAGNLEVLIVGGGGGGGYSKGGGGGGGAIMVSNPFALSHRSNNRKHK